MRHLLGSLLLAPVVLTTACAPAADESVEANAGAIVGGTEAAPGAWPGMATIYTMSLQPVCGGTLVADSWVLTAAHCLNTASPTGAVGQVVIGRHDLTTNEGEVHTVDRAIAHEGYQALAHDIALLHLAEPSSLAKTKLPLRAQLSAVVDDAMSTVVGWGNTREAGAPSNVLLQVSLPIVSNDVCKSFPGYSTVTDDMLCAGFSEGGRDSCQKDSGGPLFLTMVDTPTQIGVVSWGTGCARANAPGVYTRVGNYLDWIFEQTGGAAGEPQEP